MTCDYEYEELAAFAAGDVDADREAQIRRHLEDCETCRLRLGTIRQADTALRSLRPHRPSADALLNIRRALSTEVRGAATPEIMTLEEVAAFLRIEQDELQEVVSELPAFELAGRMRVRKAKLLEWIERRERRYLQAAAASDLAMAIKLHLHKGVAS